jgi:nucleotide-binding universal stress UspA family protein
MATVTSPIPMDLTEVFTVFKKFVVAYDFSTSAETALEYALDLAARQNAEVILVHAQDRQAVAVGAAKEATQNIPLDLGERLELIAESSRKQGISAKWLLKTGSTAEALSRVVDDLRPDMLFLGAYGNNRLDRKVLGSTAESFLRTLPCPVITIGPKAVKRNVEPDHPIKMICPIDFPEDLHERLRIIARLAKALCADVELVHAVDVCHEYSRPHSAADIQFEFDLWVSRLLQEGVVAQSTLLYGTPECVISDRAQAVNADYILFGLHKGLFSSYFRKSLVAKVIKNAHCATLTYAQTVRANLRDIEQ